jgi:hypothetical protein
VINRNAELNESLLWIVEVIRENIRALDSQEALVLKHAAYIVQVSVEHDYLVWQKHEL